MVDSAGASDARLSELVLDLYRCALDRNRWQGVLSNLSQVLGAPQAALVSHDQLDGVIQTVAVFHGSDPEGIDLYNEYFHLRDPWAAAFKARGGFGARRVAVLRGDALVPDEHFRRSEFHADFGRRFQMSRNLMVTSSPADGTSATSLTLPSGVNDRAYHHDALRMLRWLAPHLEQALALGRVIDQAEVRTAGLAAGLDHIDRPMALLESDGTVRHTNHAMRALMRSRTILVELGGRLRPVRGAARQLFATALRGMDALSDGRIGEVVPTVVPLSVVSGRAVVMHVAPVGFPRPVVVVRVEGLVAASPGGLESMADHFGLTPTERRMVALLCDGLTASDIGVRLNLQPATVRWHLKQAFAKTNSRTQAQLVARVLRGTADLPSGR